MTRFLQLLLIFALAFLVVTSLKAAETRQIYSKQHPYWAVACYITVDDKKFSHCTMSADYNKEEDFYYMVTRWGYQEIKILNWDWKGNVDTKKFYDTRWKFDDTVEYEYKAQGKIEDDGTPGFVTVTDIDFSFWRNLADSKSVDIWIGKTVIGSFKLPGTRVAITDMMKKVDKFTAKYPPGERPTVKKFDFDSSPEPSTQKFNF